MKIEFLGATHTVTGSKYLITTDNNKKILIDCGLFQGFKELRLRNWSNFPLAPKQIDAVILTHAHIDHSGYLPLLVKNGFTGKIYCTNATKDLCNILLPDSGFLQEEEARRANKYGYSKHKPALALYTKADAELALKQLVGLDFDREYEVVAGSKNTIFSFKVVGHILGAAAILLKDKDHKNISTSILFSGDIGRPNDPIMYPPASIKETIDYLVVESTYGSRLHENTDPQKKLCEVINTTIKRGGTLVIPAFAVGRTQNILYYIYELKKARKIPDVPVFLDSPMATDATETLMRYHSELRISTEQCDAACKVAQCANTVEESKHLDTIGGPKIIISASGMATGGRVLHHLRTFLGDSRNTVLFVGYQAEGTRGDKMLKGAPEIKMFGELVPVQAEIVELSNMSAHADYQEILDWLKNFSNHPPRKTFITHGELKSSESLQEKIQKTYGWNCLIPKYLQMFEL
jgi:metallo-beta-lactamase family protein